MFALARLSQAKIGTFDLKSLSVQEMDFLIDFLNTQDKINHEMQKNIK